MDEDKEEKGSIEEDDKIKNKDIGKARHFQI